jgi:hypothetical protein
MQSLQDVRLEQSLVPLIEQAHAAHDEEEEEIVGPSPTAHPVLDRLRTKKTWIRHVLGLFSVTGPVQLALNLK